MIAVAHTPIGSLRMITCSNSALPAQMRCLFLTSSAYECISTGYRARIANQGD